MDARQTLRTTERKTTFFSRLFVKREETDTLDHCEKNYLFFTSFRKTRHQDIFVALFLYFFAPHFKIKYNV